MPRHEFEPRHFSEERQIFDLLMESIDTQKENFQVSNLNTDVGSLVSATWTLDQIDRSLNIETEDGDVIDVNGNTWRDDEESLTRQWAWKDFGVHTYSVLKENPDILRSFQNEIDSITLDELSNIESLSPKPQE